MEQSKIKEFLQFVLAVTIYHTVTYLIVGILASSLIDYKNIFLLPVIRDYYREFGSVEIYLGPVLQIIRGILFGLVLFPLRDFLKTRKLSWLWLWLLFVGIGILGTPAAAPASLEGVIYSKLPLWFHILGLPEILLQTLAFSFLVHRYLRKTEQPLPAFVQKILKALVLTSLSFIGYTVISLIFAFAAGVTVQHGGADARVLGQFIGPLVITFLIILLSKPRWWLLNHIAMYILSAGALGMYQYFVLGYAGFLYILVAPILPVLISVLLSWPKRAKI